VNALLGHPPQHGPPVRKPAWFDDPTLSREIDGTTTLRGPVPDQAALHGLLAKVRDLGVTLISVEVIDASG
jgi:hypothetical protein